MSKITEEQFTSAMQRAVEKRGETWAYPRRLAADVGYYNQDAPTYSDLDGNPTCLVGAAMHEAGLPVPHYTTTASSLTVLGSDVPLTVSIAARCAQVYQDRRQPWGECFRLYEAALVVAKRMQKENVLSMFVAMDVFHEAKRMLAGAPVASESVGAVANFATLLAEFDKSVVSASDAIIALEISIDSSAFAEGGIVVNGSKVLVTPSVFFEPIVAPVLKKDHALVA